jgi:putative tricarboxylic transport membrane protein
MTEESGSKKSEVATEAAAEVEAQAAAEVAAFVRWPELLVALFLMALAVLVITDSLRVGISWADDGPKAGYFPFYIGVLLFGSSGWVALTTLLKWRKLTESFVEREAFSGVLAVAWPSLIFVGLIAFVGIYVASIILIAFFMKRHGKYGWALTAAVSVGVMALFFLVFERWFLVPLPKGPLEALMGF